MVRETEGRSDWRLPEWAVVQGERASLLSIGRASRFGDECSVGVPSVMLETGECYRVQVNQVEIMADERRTSEPTAKRRAAGSS